MSQLNSNNAQVKKYVPPSKRKGATEAQKKGTTMADSNNMFTEDVKRAFTKQGWVSGSGGDLYFDGKGGATHPHLHMKLNNKPLGKDDDIRGLILMLAVSDGEHGTTVIQNGKLKGAKETGKSRCTNERMRDEFDWATAPF